LPKSELQEAITYLRNEWNAVVDIFNYGDTCLDNNMVERMNRYISLSRKNSLFFGSHKGAERGAILYTIALTCRMHKVNLFEYLTDVINRTAEWQPNTPIEKYRELLPDRWEKDND
ncbi:IS66 family transposase, partial [Bacteroides ovatus]